MLGINSIASCCESWEMECDRYQHYFYDDLDTEEDFYKSTAPSEDIWKKFELLPTPPMSPTRTLNGEAVHFSPGDKLNWLSKVLGQDEEYEGPNRPGSVGLFGNPSSIIIQDCMWSSFSANKHLEKVNERLGTTAQLPAPPVPQNQTCTSKAQCVSLEASAANTLATDCVDPAAVLTFPAPATSCRKPASSGSESRSDSSDDDEEIDVVTVESRQSRARLVRSRTPVTITVRADPCPQRFHLSVHRQQHNYAARSPDSDLEPEEEEDDDEEEEEEDDEAEEEPQTKRLRPEPNHHRSGPASPPSSIPPPVPSSSSSSSSDSPQSSDAEDTDRRRNHNFQERKRRNDLRSRFLALRDQVPGLAESAKTPRVAILTEATEYLVQLHAKERHQAQERKRLRARQQQLLRRLADLKRS